MTYQRKRRHDQKRSQRPDAISEWAPQPDEADHGQPQPAKFSAGTHCRFEQHAQIERLEHPTQPLTTQKAGAKRNCRGCEHTAHEREAERRRYCSAALALVQGWKQG